MTSSTSQRALTLGGAALAALAAREAIARAREADLSGHVALITGGSRGLGLALARELAREGCRLAICARDEAELERAAAELRGRGAEVLAIRCDVADKDDVDRMIERVQATYGRIVTITSIGGKISVPHLLPYNAAKFAAVGLSEELRAERGRGHHRHDDRARRDADRLAP